jgi:ribosome-binding protein aMBF1 (putative translation factor)
MRTHEQIIVDAGGYKGLSAQLGLSEAVVRFWERRKSIPTKAWRALAHAQISTLEELAESRVSKAHTLTNSDAAEKPGAVRRDNPAHAGVGG